jgi:hypothetical protein
LFDINAREQGMSVVARTEHRQKGSVPALVAIKKYIDTLDDQVVLPKSDLGEALGYLRNHWEALCVYASDGRIPIDNNRVEQLMREVALGRNYAEFPIMLRPTANPSKYWEPGAGDGKSYA